MSQKGIVALVPLILIIGGLVVGAYFISTSTGFLPSAFFTQTSAPRSSTIKIATGSGKLATPSASLKASPSASQSAKPSAVATSSAKPSASSSAQPKQASPSASAKLGFPGQPDAKIPVPQGNVQGVSESRSLFQQILDLIL